MLRVTLAGPPELRQQPGTLKEYAHCTPPPLRAMSSDRPTKRRKAVTIAARSSRRSARSQRSSTSVSIVLRLISQKKQTLPSSEPVDGVTRARIARSIRSISAWERAQPAQVDQIGSRARPDCQAYDHVTLPTTLPGSPHAQRGGRRYNHLRSHM